MALQALEMVNDIRTAFTEIVMELDWMDTETKERTLEKAHAMRPFIGFPGWLLTPGELEKYYEGVSGTTASDSLPGMCLHAKTPTDMLRVSGRSGGRIVVRDIPQAVGGVGQNGT
jgi:predicted metalloendopeptidase